MSVDANIYKTIVAVQSIPSVATPSLFQNASGIRLSPIDRFIANTSAINTIYVPYNDPNQVWPPELGTLVVLGYMSAIESYFRALISELVTLDEAAQRLVAPKQVSFAAATHNGDGWLLSEALLEHISFATAGEIERALGAYVGLKNLPPDVRKALEEFKKLCELRHCCVHRFGKLGSQNALELGFEAHRSLIERPFTPTVADVETIADALQIIVKTLNNYIYAAVLDRTVHDGLNGLLSWKWSWNYNKDRRRFIKYYDLFAIKQGVTTSPPALTVYESMRQQHKQMILAKARKGQAESSTPEVIIN